MNINEARESFDQLIATADQNDAITHITDDTGQLVAAIVPPHVAEFYEQALDEHDARMVGDILDKVDSGEEEVLSYEDAFPADDNEGK